MSEPLIGVSTAVIAGSTRFEELLWYEPDLVEVYNYSVADTRTLCALAEREGVRTALHTPTPHNGPLHRFAPTGPDPDDAATAARLVARTAAFAEGVGALHVVVHYPSPYPPHHKSALDRFGPPFLEHLRQLQERHGVPILVENLSAHPLLSTPEHYAAIPDPLGFCLDLGHAHLMPRHRPEDYAATLTKRVRSVHVYNTTRDRNREHGHEPAHPGQHPSDGYLDLAATVAEVVARCRPHALVLEHSGPVTPEAAAACAAWVRTLATAERGVTATGGNGGM